MRQAPSALMTVSIATAGVGAESGRLRVMQAHLVVTEARLVVNKLMLRPASARRLLAARNVRVAIRRSAGPLHDGLGARHEVAVAADALARRVVVEREPRNGPLGLEAAHRQNLAKRTIKCDAAACRAPSNRSWKRAYRPSHLACHKECVRGRE